MFLLDTNAISALRRPNHGNPNVLAWAARINLAEFFLSTIIVFEIERGILLLNRRDPGQAAMLRAWMDDRVMADFADRILPVDIPVARRCAALHVPDPRPERDAMIAATALVHGLTVVTRNTADFLSTGVPLANPWEDAA
ncbi:type II toxin-antitoxin system VapC family toxin [Sphingomonas sp. VNH70]|uniref:type II toxin-antitoxin system VapC family toxin n=1 Tax=Sphingomonas silueang TaxID=3156617 RepID=UPI0032B3B6AA